MELEMTDEVADWKEQLASERQERVDRFRQILGDEQRMLEAMGDEAQQMELLTMLRYDIVAFGERVLTPEELDIMSAVYDAVVRHSGIVLVGGAPNWFLTPNELVCKSGIYYLDEVQVSKCVTGEILRTGSGDEPSREDEEEACLRQATVWADLNHPHVAKMLGACHIGNEPFVVHEPAEPLISNRASAQSWEPLLGWALGLQYLHERELGYKNFDHSRLLARCHVTASGVLSGLGLVPVKRALSASLQRGVSDKFNMEALAASLSQDSDVDNQHKLHTPTWSVSNDIFEFGLAIYNTRHWVRMYGEEQVPVLPLECPPFLSKPEWNLVEKMCTRSPQERANMWYVVHQLQTFIRSSVPSSEKNIPVDLSVSLDSEDDPSPPNNIDDFIVPKMNVKVARAMSQVKQKYEEMPKPSRMLQHVIDRLSGLLIQLQSRENNATSAMEGFASVLDMFYDLLDRRDIGKEQSSSSEVASFCASRAAAQNVAIFHHEIDRLLTLAELPAISASAPTHLMLADTREDSSDSIDVDTNVQMTDVGTQNIHNWLPKWRRTRREQLRAFEACLKNTEELKRQLNDPKDRLEAQMLLQFELHKRRSSYPNSVLEAMAHGLAALETLGGAAAVPRWFIPPYEIVLGKYITQGGFGDVYYGKWFDTDVVVKILKVQGSVNSSSKGAPKGSPPPSNSGSSDKDAMELFRSEADHWFMLNHQNVVQLYGACHVGIPFFVCEPAKSTSLNTHVKALACAIPDYNYEEKGDDPTDIMRCLYLAGIGLKYLHERGIVHCDLKGNNFMVGTDSKTIKLGDFGMSVLKRSGKGRHSAHANAGAIPWKAPEYLKGEDPTVMSDVYGFGMCILELVSGNFPWAGLPEAAVKFHVTKRKALPNRPKKASNLQWSLIQHMCCYEPNNRISLDAVVDMLFAFRFVQG
ncbi:unnamed protein product [Phytophthora fragariaefolia]|uniref:Unnamed protein product n=1 Tax=Phytophthora fragariaefolia TaxID=1490495 RepID=A0A9W6YDN6_9STRA|nr:unnamed protein product [Phytophthora fragariaefolia]